MVRVDRCATPNFFDASTRNFLQVAAGVPPQTVAGASRSAPWRWILIREGTQRAQRISLLKNLFLCAICGPSRLTNLRFSPFNSHQNFRRVKLACPRKEQRPYCRFFSAAKDEDGDNKVPTPYTAWLRRMRCSGLAVEKPPPRSRLLHSLFDDLIVPHWNGADDAWLVGDDFFRRTLEKFFFTGL